MSKGFQIRKLLFFENLLKNPGQNFGPDYDFNQKWDIWAKWYINRKLLTSWVQIRSQKNSKKFLKKVRDSQNSRTQNFLPHNFLRLKCAPNMYIFIYSARQGLSNDIQNAHTTVFFLYPTGDGTPQKKVGP